MKQLENIPSLQPLSRQSIPMSNQPIPIHQRLKPTVLIYINRMHASNPRFLLKLLITHRTLQFIKNCFTTTTPNAAKTRRTTTTAITLLTPLLKLVPRNSPMPLQIKQQIHQTTPIQSLPKMTKQHFKISPRSLLNKTINPVQIFTSQIKFNITQNRLPRPRPKLPRPDLKNLTRILQIVIKIVRIVKGFEKGLDGQIKFLIRLFLVPLV